jgi:hypothetical protein
MFERFIVENIIYSEDQCLIINNELKLYANIYISDESECADIILNLLKTDDTCYIMLYDNDIIFKISSLKTMRYIKI